MLVVLINFAAVLLCVLTPSYAETVYYDDLGCFSDDPPFNNAIGHLPQSPAEIGTRFFLYTKAGASPELLDYNDPDGVNGSTFDPHAPTKIIIHGFRNTDKQEWVVEMRNAFLTTGKYNVIVVGWGIGASSWNYPQVVSNARVVARQIAKLLEVLQQTKDLDFDSVHMIGFSVGAHLAGQASLDLGLEVKVGRITGLDAAGPLYQRYDTAVKLDPSDAVFVDTYHSDGHTGGFGTYISHGHVDFFPNGGAHQPRCDNNICDHSKAHAQFIASIHNSCQMTSFPCESQASYELGECVTCGSIGCNTPGLFVNTSSGLGNQFYATTDAAPFCGQNYRVNIELGQVDQLIHGQIEVSLQGETGNKTSWSQVAKGELSTNGSFTSYVAFKETVGPVASVSVLFTPLREQQTEGALASILSSIFGLDKDQPVPTGDETVEITEVVVQPVPDGRRMISDTARTLTAKQSSVFDLQ